MTHPTKFDYTYWNLHENIRLFYSNYFQIFLFPGEIDWNELYWFLQLIFLLIALISGPLHDREINNSIIFFNSANFSISQWFAFFLKCSVTASIDIQNWMPKRFFYNHLWKPWFRLCNKSSNSFEKNLV